MKSPLVGTDMGSIELKTKLPGPKSLELMKTRENHVARGPFHTVPIFLSKALGSVLTDVDGNQLLDFAAGIGVTNTGHSPEPVVAAICEQAGRFLHAGFNVTPYDGYVRLARKLNELTPGDFPKKTFLANSGAEAVENAIKIARVATGRKAIVCFDHAFHGRTYMAMTLTAKATPYKRGFEPFNPDVYRVPFPYTYRWPNPSSEASVSGECFQQFKELLTSQLHPEQVAAVIVEPVLGEGGFVPLTKVFAQKLEEFCKQHGILIIADEIQTGFGRTGNFFASDHLGWAPDLITMAKGLGSGMPISAVTGRAEIMDAPAVGGIGGTYCGNPLACEAALAGIKMLEENGILSKAKILGECLASRLQQFYDRYELVGDVRGLGPMRAMELVKDRATREPNGQAAKDVIKFCYERGLILMTAGTYGNVVRFLMPLVTELDQLNEGLDIVEEALKTAGN